MWENPVSFQANTNFAWSGRGSSPASLLFVPVALPIIDGIELKGGRWRGGTQIWGKQRRPSVRSYTIKVIMFITHRRGAQVRRCGTARTGTNGNPRRLPVSARQVRGPPPVIISISPSCQGARPSFLIYSYMSDRPLTLGTLAFGGVHSPIPFVSCLANFPLLVIQRLLELVGSSQRPGLARFVLHCV